MTMTNERLYTTKEVAKILSVSDYRPKDGVKRGILVPTDINPNVGRYGQNLFNADAIRKYAAILKITPNFAAVGDEHEDEINEDGSITLTPENFERVVHGSPKDTDVVHGASSDNCVVHGNDPKPEASKENSDARFINDFAKQYNMSNKDLADILNITEKKVEKLRNGDSALLFEDVMALCTAAKVEKLQFSTEKYFAFDPDRYHKLSSWVPYEKAKLMQEYAELQARMKQIEKELGEK